jgi:hypothetical protein
MRLFIFDWILHSLDFKRVGRGLLHMFAFMFVSAPPFLLPKEFGSILGDPGVEPVHVHGECQYVQHVDRAVSVDVEGIGDKIDVVDDSEQKKRQAEADIRAQTREHRTKRQKERRELFDKHEDKRCGKWFALHE